MKTAELFEGDIIPLRPEFSGPHGRAKKIRVINLDELKFLWKFCPTLNDDTPGLTALELKRLEKEQGRPFKTYSTKFLFNKSEKTDFNIKHGRNVRAGEMVHVPNENTFIVRFGDGAQYLAYRRQSSRMISGWIYLGGGKHENVRAA